MNAEIELHFAPSESNSAYFTVTHVEVSCPTELANLAYKMQQEQGYRIRTVLKLNGKIKTKVIGLAAEHVTFGPAIDRDENGLPDYGEKKKKK